MATATGRGGRLISVGDPSTECQRLFLKLPNILDEVCGEVCDTGAGRSFQRITSPGAHDRNTRLARST